jgi:hypothetical protein
MPFDSLSIGLSFGLISVIGSVMIGFLVGPRPYYHWFYWFDFTTTSSEHLKN